MIRLMTINDYEDVYSMWTAQAGVGLRSLDDSREGIEKFLKRNPLSCFVSCDGDKVTGSILCGHDGRRGYIYHAMVKPECRGKGIGKALLNAAMEAMKKEGIHKAALIVYHTNELGNGFWESQGFTTREDLIYRNKSLNDENV